MSQLPADVDAFGGIVPNPLGPNVSQEQYKRRRGAESKYFDKSQTAEMDALIPELLQFLRSPRTNEEFAEWTEGKATILLSRPTFLSAITPVADGTRTVKHAQHKIHRFFYHRKPKQTRTGTSSTSSSSTSSSSALSPAATTSSSTSSTSTTSTFAEDEALRIVRLARRSKLLLEGEYKARDHFIASNAELIQEKIKELKSTSTVNGKALENIAISKLWNDADKALYESMANDFAANVSGNQESFPWLLHTMLTDIVKTNLLGDVALKLNLAFRDAQSDLKTYTVRVAYNATSRSTVEFVPKHQDEEESSWAIEADGLLPRHVETPLVKIMTNGAGVPMWPSIDLENTTPRQLKGVVEMYLKAVWKYSKGKDLDIQVGTLVGNINNYIDSSVFCFPFKDELTMDFGDLSRLAKYFASLSRSSQPFHFLQSNSGPSPAFHPRSPSPPTPGISPPLPGMPAFPPVATPSRLSSRSPVSRTPLPQRLQRMSPKKQSRPSPSPTKAAMLVLGALSPSSRHAVTQASTPIHPLGLAPIPAPIPSRQPLATATAPSSSGRPVDAEPEQAPPPPVDLPGTEEKEKSATASQESSQRPAVPKPRKRKRDENEKPSGNVAPSSPRKTRSRAKPVSTTAASPLPAPTTDAPPRKRHRARWYMEVYSPDNVLIGYKEDGVFLPL